MRRAKKKAGGQVQPGSVLKCAFWLSLKELHSVWTGISPHPSLSLLKRSLLVSCPSHWVTSKIILPFHFHFFQSWFYLGSYSSCPQFFYSAHLRSLSFSFCPSFLFSISPIQSPFCLPCHMLTSFTLNFTLPSFNLPWVYLPISSSLFLLLLLLHTHLLCL